MNDFTQIVLVAFGAFVAVMLAWSWLELRAIRRAIERRKDV